LASPSEPSFSESLRISLASYFLNDPMQLFISMMTDHLDVSRLGGHVVAMLGSDQVTVGEAAQ
jgi:hypothetical protein